MEEVERRYQCVMVAAVQTVDAVAHGLRVLNVFKPLAARKSLFSVFYVMIDHVSHSAFLPSPPLRLQRFSSFWFNSCKTEASLYKPSLHITIKKYLYCCIGHCIVHGVPLGSHGNTPLFTRSSLCSTVTLRKWRRSMCFAP